MCCVGRKRMFRLIFPSTGETATWKAAGSSAAIAGGACTENKILPAIGGLHIDIFNFGGTQIEEANYIPAFVSLHGILAFADGGTGCGWRKPG